MSHAVGMGLMVMLGGNVALVMAGVVCDWPVLALALNAFGIIAALVGLIALPAPGVTL